MAMKQYIGVAAAVAAVPLSIFALQEYRVSMHHAGDAEAASVHAMVCVAVGESFERCVTDEVICYRYAERSSDNLGRLQCRWKI